MKKLFTFLFAAMGLTAMADNTVTVKYDFENYKLETNGLPTNPKFYSWYELNSDATENPIWASGNSAFVLSVMLGGGDKSPAAFPTSMVEEGFDGACVKLETKSTGGMGVGMGMPIAAGNLFVGSFDSENIMDPMAATQFGKVFDKKPLRFSGYYKYQAGEKVTDKKNQVLEGKVDKGQIYSVLYKNKDAEGKDVVLNGADVLTNENIVAIADAGEITDVAEWTKFDVSFDYKENVIDEEILKAGGYSLTVVFTSSVEGASFIGAVGSTMYVDKVELVCEAAESSTTYTDNLKITLKSVVDGSSNVIESENAQVIVTKQNDGKYTFTLKNFTLDMGEAGSMSVGTIHIKNLEGAETENGISLKADNTVAEVVDGDDENVEWMAKNLMELFKDNGGVPVSLDAEMTKDKLYAKLFLPLGFMNVDVEFGSKTSTSIDNISNGAAQQPAAIYTLDGRKATDMQPGNVYIIRKADGKTVKVIK
ncbi:hypothetical protein HPS57_04625 [Prevotella sp. PINT]|jgi:hypothetical protein|uniref:PCMD domain-containing protein n=1 Tax=Palleniella intestinalis TaxID=2736291 RepID=UPI0015540AF8|nr:PCMD domain-containing protein [Palleniella intestinalis]NPD81256.1 hypothetical protein [Palleniella intestinalis]